MSHSASLSLTSNAESISTTYTAFPPVGEFIQQSPQNGLPKEHSLSRMGLEKNITSSAEQCRTLMRIETLTYFHTLAIFEEHLIFPDWHLRQYQNSILGGVRNIFSITATSRAKTKKFVEKLAKSLEPARSSEYADKWARDLITDKHRHARALFFFHHAMSVVQHYRHHFATDPVVREVIADEARRCHDNRLTLGELTEAYLRAEIREGAHVDRERVADDFETMLQFFRRYLEKKANDDATLFCRLTNTERDNVVHREIRGYLRESYLERFVDNGLSIPRVQKAISMSIQSN